MQFSRICIPTNGCGKEKVSGPATIVPDVSGVLERAQELPPSGEPSMNTVPMNELVFVRVRVVDPTVAAMLAAETPVPVNVVIVADIGGQWVGCQAVNCGRLLFSNA